MSFKLDNKGREVLSDKPVAVFVDDLSHDPMYVHNQMIIKSVLQSLGHNTYNGSYEQQEDLDDFDVEYKDDLEDNTQYTNSYNRTEDASNVSNNSHYNYSSSSNLDHTPSINSVSSDVGTPKVPTEKIEEK